MAGMPAMTYMGFASAIVVLFSMAIAVTLLPACLGFAGRNIDRWSIPHRKDRVGRRPPDVRRPVGRPRRPAPVAVRDRQPARRSWRSRSRCSTSRWASPTTPTPPTTATQHLAYDLLTDGFGAGFNGPYTVVVDLGESASRRPLETIVDRDRRRPGRRRGAAAAAQRLRRATRS